MTGKLGLKENTDKKVIGKNPKGKKATLFFSSHHAPAPRKKRKEEEGRSHTVTE